MGYRPHAYDSRVPIRSRGPQLSTILAKKKGIKEKEQKKIKKKKFFLSMKTFEEIISLLDPEEKYNPVLKQCQQMWESFSSEKQDFVYQAIKEKKERKEFVDFNPLFAIKKSDGE